MYSVAIDWVGVMVERVNGGVRLGEYMKQHIFDPLGMTLTGFRLAENEHIRDRLCDPRPLLAKTQDSKSGAMLRSGIDCDAWNFGLGGILTTADVEGICRKGTMSWGGLPNLVLTSCLLRARCFMFYIS